MKTKEIDVVSFLYVGVDVHKDQHTAVATNCFGQTLFEKEKQKEVLRNLKKIAKQLIIVDIEDPQNSTLKSKLWNDYYVHLLGDQGESFLTFSEFKSLVNSEKDKCDKIKFGIINTIKGKYFYASVKTP